MEDANGSSSAGTSGDRKSKDGRRDRERQQQHDQPNLNEKEEDKDLGKLMQHFIKSSERDLLTQQKCISSKVGYVNVEFIEQCIKTLKATMFVEKGTQVIVAFEKKSAGEMSSSSQPEEKATVVHVSRHE